MRRGEGEEEGDGYPFRERVGGGGPGGTFRTFFFPRRLPYVSNSAVNHDGTAAVFYGKPCTGLSSAARGVCPNVAAFGTNSSRCPAEHRTREANKPKRVRRLLSCRQKNRHV